MHFQDYITAPPLARVFLPAAWGCVHELISSACTCSTTTAILLMEVEVMLPHDSLTPALPSLLRSF
jgi:hypothetical protein